MSMYEWFLQHFLCENYNKYLCYCVHIFACVCCVVSVNLQKDTFGARAVWIAWIRKEKAARHQQEHDDKDWAQTGQDPLGAPYQVDEVQLKQTETYVTWAEEQSTQQFYEITKENIRHEDKKKTVKNDFKKLATQKNNPGLFFMMWEYSQKRKRGRWLPGWQGRPAPPRVVFLCRCDPW